MITFFTVIFFIGLGIFALIVGRHQLQRKHYGRGILLGLLSLFLILEGILGPLTSSEDDTRQAQTTKTRHKKNSDKDRLEDETSSDNTDLGLKPGDKIDTDSVEKHEFYYSDGEENPEIRYFTNNNKKITAIKVLYRPDPRSTEDVKTRLSNILDDDNLKFGDDKEKDPFLDVDEVYNVYSPENEKWYHIRMQSSEEDKVGEFSLWPGKEGEVSN